MKILQLNKYFYQKEGLRLFFSTQSQPWKTEDIK